MRNHHQNNDPSRRSVLVGRDAELRRTNDLLHTALTGRGSSLAFLGEAGIGKTALLEAVTAKADNFDVRHIIGVPSEMSLPYAGLQALLTQRRPAEVNRLRSNATLGGVAGICAASGAQPNTVTLGAALLRHLSSLGDEHPLLVVVDDLQWIDPSSAAALMFAARRILADRVAMLFALRTDVGDVHHTDTLGIETLILQPLSDEASAAMLKSLGTPSQQVPWSTARGGGLPLFLHELAHASADEGAFGATAGFEAASANRATLPARLTSLIQSLDSDAQEICALAALEDDLSVVIAANNTIVRSSDHDEIPAASTPPLAHPTMALTRAEDAGVIRVSGNRIRFRHPLLRAAALSNCPAAKQRLLHSSLATALEQSVDPAAADKAALHRAAASVGFDDSAADAMAGFAERACARGALTEGADAYLRSAELTESPEHRWERKLEGAYQRFHSGDAEQCLTIAAELVATPTNRRDLLLRLDQMIATASQWERRPADVAAKARDLAAALEATDPSRSARQLVTAASVAFLGGELKLGVADALTAVERASGAGDEIAALEARAYLLWNLSLSGDPRASSPEQVGVRGFFEQLSTAPDEFGIGAAVSVAMQSLIQQRWETTRTAVSNARSARDAGLHLSALILEGIEESLFLRLGRWREALVRATARIEETPMPAISLAWTRARTAQITAAMGDDQQTRSLVASSMKVCDQLGLPLVRLHLVAALGALHLGAGDSLGAVAHLDEAAAITANMGMRNPTLVMWHGDWFDALIDIGRVNDARAAIDDLAGSAQHADSPDEHLWEAGIIARSNGRLSDDAAEANEAFEEALSHFRTLSMPFECARTHLRRATQFTDSSRAKDATDDLVEAARIFRRIGATAWADRTELLLGSAVRAPDPSIVSLVTAAELRVAYAVASGRTNAEVAADLYLSVKTVEFHLRSMYTKLGVRNRVEFGRAFARLSGS